MNKNAKIVQSADLPARYGEIGISAVAAAVLYGTARELPVYAEREEPGGTRAASVARPNSDVPEFVQS